MFSFKRVVYTGRVIVPQCASLSVNNFSACQFLPSPKRHSPYSSVDSERYSSLVKSVMSSKVSSQTPETLKAEDEHIFGPVVREQTPSSEPKTFHPFLQHKDTLETGGDSRGPPVRIPLNRGQGGASVPSVTRILQQTLSPDQIFYLDRWKRRMIEKLGEEGFEQYSQALFRQGKLFHSAVEDALTSGGALKRKKEYTPEVRGYLESISHTLEDMSEVKAIESAVQHQKLNYIGIADCVARYRGVLCVIDWKTSEKPKPFLSNTFDNPIQVAAYAGALNSDANYKYQVENGLIVVAYKDGSPAHAHRLKSELMLEYWNTWLTRLEYYNEKR
ncbi:Mitochondrial genome maintenance exonuclease 1 [Takifugu flavidus]|nr:Mitochondrial genome maintenance exonuclease 1 [Takifugu flavidus]